MPLFTKQICFVKMFQYFLKCVAHDLAVSDVRADFASCAAAPLVAEQKRVHKSLGLRHSPSLRAANVALADRVDDGVLAFFGFGQCFR